ncbi:ABC transporter substrate-binding protein [Cumulibacter soli]|uniref:ABC transporter substrate-binding protein n=1 Tax=Cumulibacter soli TaxID=2546344 RepID=UPI00106766AC|nr:ABC transporter substrate-binding protein [Cumulibacter soli]
MRSLFRHNHRVVGAVIGVALIASLTACGSSDDETSGGTPVAFAIGAPVLIDSTAPYSSVPLEMGYWSDEGLSVEPQGTQGATAALQLVLAGQAEISNGGTSSMYQAAVEDPDVRVISLQKANQWKIDVPSSSSINQIADLKGKKIGVQSLSSASYLFGRAAVSASGLDPDADVEWIAIGVASQAAQAIQEGTVDAYATYSGPNAIVNNFLDDPLVDLPTPLDEIPGLAGLATTKDYLESNRDEVVGFLSGFYKGAVFADANPAAALQIHWQAYPEQKPDGDLQEAIDATVPTVEERFGYPVEPGPDGNLGAVSMDDAQEAIDFMYENGVIDEQLNAEDVVDLSPSIDANNFDIDAVKEEAENWTP